MSDRMRLVHWLAANEKFRAERAHAREVGFMFSRKGCVDVEPGLAKSRRLEVDTGKWLLSKLCRRYADKVEQEVTGPGGGPVQIGVILTQEGSD